jgi:hypothetical protein
VGQRFAAPAASSLQLQEFEGGGNARHYDQSNQER